MPTTRVALVWLVVPLGAPETDAPILITPPLSSPFGPVPMAGELVWRLNQSHNTCACAQEVMLELKTLRFVLPTIQPVPATNLAVLKSGSFVELFPPGPVQRRLVVQLPLVAMMLLVYVTMELVWKRINFSASAIMLPSRYMPR